MGDIEFNNGFVTALSLFYAHRYEGYNLNVVLPLTSDFRIYGAADHLFDIEYPAGYDLDFVKDFVRKVLEVRLEPLSMEEADALFDECLEVLKRIDKEIFGLDVQVKFP